MSENRVIGKKGVLPWYIPGDLKRFRERTTGHPIIMGRKTYESIGKPLPKRTNIIITRDENYKVDGGIVVNSLEKSLREAQGKETEEIFVIGGGEIFKQSLPLTDRLYLTIVHQKIDGDVYFPEYSEFTKEIFKQDEESNGYKYTLLTLEK